jgi:predicted enzyme related to lactoylglutathione lyase
MLYVKDFARMRSFYGELFGADAVNTEWTDTWARFDVGGASFALHAIPADIAREVEISAVPREKSPFKFIFQVDDVDHERRRLEALSIRTIQRPWQDPSESFEAVDPEGNIFQISASIRDRI